MEDDLEFPCYMIRNSEGSDGIQCSQCKEYFWTNYTLAKELKFYSAVHFDEPFAIIPYSLCSLCGLMPRKWDGKQKMGFSILRKGVERYTDMYFTAHGKESPSQLMKRMDEEYEKKHPKRIETHKQTSITKYFSINKESI